jgi:excisionase family DNA binding protein
MSADHLMNVQEVAEYLGLAGGTIYHFVSEGKLPCVHLSARCLRFRRSEIDAWIAAKVDNACTVETPTRRRKF